MEAKDLLIREINDKDGAMVAEFFANLSAQSTWMFNKSGFNTRRALDYVDGNTANRKYWIAVEPNENGKDERIAGCVFLWSLNKCIPWFGIVNADAWRGKHLGSRLMEHAINYCKGNGYGGILLSTRFENEPAQKLYEKWGFKKMGKFRERNTEYLYLLCFDKTKGCAQ